MSEFLLNSFKLSEIKDKYAYNKELSKFWDKPLIYGIYFQESNKFYIGQTKNFKRRLYHYLNKDNNGGHLVKSAILKYNKDKIFIKVLEIISLEDLDNREIFYIELYNSYIKDKGYNLTFGGQKGKVNSETLLKKIESSRKVKVASYDLKGQLIKIYNSVKEASRELNIGDSDIHRCCKTKGRRNGYLFSKGLEKEIEVLNPNKIKGRWNKSLYKVIDTIKNEEYVFLGRKEVADFLQCSVKYLNNLIERQSLYKKQFKILKHGS